MCNSVQSCGWLKLGRQGQRPDRDRTETGRIRVPKHKGKNTFKGTDRKPWAGGYRFGWGQKKSLNYGSLCWPLCFFVCMLSIVYYSTALLWRKIFRTNSFSFFFPMLLFHHPTPTPPKHYFQIVVELKSKTLKKTKKKTLTVIYKVALYLYYKNVIQYR